MEFVQIIEYSTSRPDDVMTLAKEWDRIEPGPNPPTRTVVCRDRDDQSRYVTIVFFPSYEQAMANSQAPETDAMAKRMADLVEGPPTFRNLDVVEETSR